MKMNEKKVCDEFIAHHTQPKNHYGDGTCYYNGVFPCNGCGECND